jgi:hypothetical protein
MPSGKSYDKILAEAEQIARVWEENPTFSMGDLKLSDLKTLIKELRDKRTEVAETKMKHTRLTNEAADRGAALARLSARIRSGYKATFGPDSSQYEQAGGTRESEKEPRKPGGGKKNSSDN